MNKSCISIVFNNNNVSLLPICAAYLCNDITDGSTSTGGSLEKLSSQTLVTPRLPWGTWRSLGASQKLTNAKMQGRRFSKLFNTVGSKTY